MPQPYPHVVLEDLSSHTHLKHTVHYQFTVGSQQIPPPVQVLRPAHPTLILTA